MTASRTLKIAIVAGEESGDLLGADVVKALRASGQDVRLVGVGGRHLAELGLQSAFDAGEIALVGVGAVLKDLPRLLRRIAQTARLIAEQKPDCLITIDSPEFALRVAKKVRAADRGIPIVHYVCPSVWAWRPGRAPAMRAHVDHILCILPFEVDALARLGGPPGTYVGHKLTHDPELLAAASLQAGRTDLSPNREKHILLLPGSRRSEVRGLIDIFGEAAAVLRQRGHRLKTTLPTVPHVAPMVTEMTAGWASPPLVTLAPKDKWKAFGTADAAMIASGTVSLELALVGVPMYACYMLDPISRMMVRLLTTWSAILPNIVADRPIVPEAYERYVRPETIARNMEALFSNTPLRAWQKDGFAEVGRRMATDRPSGEIAAETVLRVIAQAGKVSLPVR